MPALADSYSAAHTVVVLEPGVVRDIAHVLTGLWRPEDELDEERRRALVAAARLRLYGAHPDRSGWHLTTTAVAHARAEELGDVEWSAGFIPALDAYDDAPPDGDVMALVSSLRDESSLEGEAAETLALALLCEPVGLVIARDPSRYRHNRVADLPERLQLLDPVAAVRSLRLRADEPAPEGPPVGHLLADADPWWVPVAGDPDVEPLEEPPTFER